MPANNLNTLTTDFGTADGYVGSVKGAILSINPRARIVDLSHGVPSFDIEQGAYLLGTSFSLFPRGTVHLAVVDPGVGSARRPLLVVSKNYFFVAPDNGLLTLVTERESIREIYELTEKKFFRPSPSWTFHGRDIFGPVAAHLTRGATPRRMGRRRASLKRLDLFKTRESSEAVQGLILFIDKFGNAITTIQAPASRPEAWDSVRLRGKSIPLYRTYSEIPRGKPGALFGSSGFLELAVSEDSFLSRFGASKGEEILLKRRVRRA